MQITSPCKGLITLTSKFPCSRSHYSKAYCGPKVGGRGAKKVTRTNSYINKRWHSKRRECNSTSVSPKEAAYYDKPLLYKGIISITDNDGEFRMPLVLAQASPIFHSSCEGKLGIALE